MGFYASVVLPRVLDRVMSGENFDALRRRLLAGTRGETLEIGFGTGLNLPHYADGVQRLTAVDPNPGMHRRARRRVDGTALPVRMEILDGQSLPFEDASFDSVVSTWTLCSIPDAAAALGEILRVLRRGGTFRFVEHGLSADAGVGKWQRRLTPIQRRIAGGCRLDRDIHGLIRDAGFRIALLENFYMDGIPRVGGYMYFGRAERPSRT